MRSTRRSDYRPPAQRKATGFSLDMRQRLGIAAAPLGDPPVLTVDEPFTGMDPEGVEWIRDFLASLQPRAGGCRCPAT